MIHSQSRNLMPLKRYSDPKFRSDRKYLEEVNKKHSSNLEMQGKMKVVSHSSNEQLVSMLKAFLQTEMTLAKKAQCMIPSVK